MMTAVSSGGSVALPSASHAAAAATVSWDFVDKIVYINARGAVERDGRLTSVAAAAR
jgi:hypothetical protein